MGRLSKLVVGALLVAAVLIVVAAVGLYLLIFSLGTAVVQVSVDATALDRDTQAPVPNCLLAFEQSPTGGYGRSTVRTDAQGRSSHRTRYSYGASFLLPFQRARAPVLRFYLGEAPHYGSYDEVESWEIRLHFSEPWLRAREIVPKVTVQRSMAHEEVIELLPGRTGQGAGFNPLPTEPVDKLLRAVVRFETGSEGRQSYRIPLTLFLDKGQIEHCQAPTRSVADQKAADLFNARRYAEALEAFREAARLTKDPIWAYRGMGDCLANLGHKKESIEAYRKAFELAPNDKESLFWYANSLLDARDKEAADLFRKLIPLEPKDPRGLMGLATALDNLHRVPESIEAYRKAAELAPDDLEAPYWHANSLLGEQDKRAVDLFKKLLAREPKSARNHIGLAIALYNLDRYPESLEAFATARRLCATCLSPNDRFLETEAKRLGAAR